MLNKRQKPNVSKKELPFGFNTTGCWVRAIDPMKEIKNLALREDCEVNDLLGHDHPEKPGYTHYSPCTYIKEGLGVALFGMGVKDNFGVFVRPLTRRIDWWYNGRQEIVTDNIKPVPGKKYNNGGRQEWQLWGCSIQEIGEAVQAIHDEYADDFYYKENPEEPITMSWNEGFLRYQKKDITGLLVNPKSRESVYLALAFRQALNLPAHLYSYDYEKGACNYLNSNDLCNKLRINMESINFKNLVRCYGDHYITFLKEIREERAAMVAPSKGFSVV